MSALPSQSIATASNTPATNTPRKKRTRTKRKKVSKASPIVKPDMDLEHGALAAFFEEYSDQGFIYDPMEIPPLELRRLQYHLKIKRDTLESKELWDAFGMAMVSEFGIRFGTSLNDLQAWQRLCQRIGISPAPTNLKAARAAFKATHVNIVELMTPGIGDGEMEKFDTEEELAEYTRDTPGLTYPREFVEKGSLLENLLRRIWHKKPNQGEHVHRFSARISSYN